jgi:diacylglycerol kinase family enzyme
MRAVVIINPASGRHGWRPECGSDRADLARRVVRLAGLEPGTDVEVVLTRAPGHGAELAREYVARGIALVVAWGGDGTVNEVAGPLIGSRTALGIVPSGSGDGLARGLGLPRRPELALRLALAGTRGPIDTGRLGDRHFLNVAGIGFDAAVGAAFNRVGRRGLGAYVRRAFGEVWRYRPRPYDLDIDGEPRPGRYFLIAFANGREYGNGLRIAPDADVTDGFLNLVAVAGGTPFHQLWRARRLAVARLRPAGGVLRQRIRTARVAGERLVCHVDGEAFEATGALDVVVRPASLLVVGLG